MKRMLDAKAKPGSLGHGKHSTVSSRVPKHETGNQVRQYVFTGPASKNRRRYPALRLPWGRKVARNIRVRFRRERSPCHKVQAFS